jgi:hypothetical protein
MESRWLLSKFMTATLTQMPLAEHSNIVWRQHRRVAARYRYWIGGLRRSEYRSSNYSGAESITTVPSVPSWHRGSDAAAVADASVALHGVLAAGTRAGSVIAMKRAWRRRTLRV